MKYCLFLDDERLPPDDGRPWIVVRSVEAAVACVLENGFPAHVSIDNDLGNAPDGTLLAEGWKFAQWLIDHDLQAGGVPEDFTWFAHSRNPVRQAYIMDTFQHYFDNRERLRRIVTSD